MPKKAIDYQNTVIYKIVCNNLSINDCYVGHTTDFRKRKYGHKNACINTNNVNYTYAIYQFIRAHGGWENFSMVEVEKFPCADSNEATARERFQYEQLGANLNIYVPNRSEAEWYEQNKVLVCDKQRQYREANRNLISEHQRIYREQNRDQINARRRKNYANNKRLAAAAATL